MNRIETNYAEWLEKAAPFSDELKAMTPAEKEDAFYRNLEFGTGGLRGVLGAGTNRMNIYTVGKASQGLADYVNRMFPENRSVAIAYDSRLHSTEFAEAAASVFAANGLTVYLYPELMPTPMLSFAVRYFHAAAGIVITASHNPAKYNGYKVYGPDGCQITTEAAAEILEEIEKINLFADVKKSDFSAGKADGQIRIIGSDCMEAYFREVKKESVLFGDEADRNVSIVYTPLNGTGLKPVLRILHESGFSNISVVPEQENPDGHFPTCPYPNPEIREALFLGIRDANARQADLLLATDPDADRVGIAVRDHGELKLLTGNEVGLLLLDFICSQRLRHGKMPANPTFVKTIVTTDLAEKIAASYGVRTVNVLTGFKFIGEQIGLLEKDHAENNYILGFEESYGYLSGTYVRDKDAVDGALMICEMFAYYRTRGITLPERLSALYAEFGYSRNTLHSTEFPGADGFKKMQELMEKLRRQKDMIGPKKVLKCLDYSLGIDGLPCSNVLKFFLDGDSSVVVRPSGTEPKLKVYISVCAKNPEEAAELEKELMADLL